MKWTMNDPVKGDMIRVEQGGIYHFGIYVSDDEVIQFGLAPSRRSLLKDTEVEVLSSDIDTFLAGGFLEVCKFSHREKKKNRTPDEVVSYARSKLGTRGYNIIYNNCEHFANECVSGKAVSTQADDVRAMIRKIPVVDVYLAKLPEREIGEPLTCEMRQAEIDAVSNEKVKREKYYVWKLLNYALERSFGLKSADVHFTRDVGSRYMTEQAEFSLSHSKGSLAVAVSRSAVGVDIEAIDLPSSDDMAKRIMTDGEYAAFTALSDEEKSLAFVKTWTAKEALFKASHKEQFSPASVNTANGGFSVFEKEIDTKCYILSVATATPEKIRFFENIPL